MQRQVDGAASPALAVEGRSLRLHIIGNAFAAGKELKAVLLKVLDAVEEGGSVSEEDLCKMVADIGTTTPYSMANATGGAKHASKAVGPLKWLLSECSDGFQDSQFYEPNAHAVDLPVSIHQGVSPEALEEGACGIIKFFLGEVYGSWLPNSVDLLVVAYDRNENVPCIKGFEQGARTEKVGKCDKGFNPLCTEPLPSSKYQAWLRANEKAARDGLATYLSFCGLSDQQWLEAPARGVTLAFYGVDGDPPNVEVPGGSLVRQQGGDEGQGQDAPGEKDLLHFRSGGSATSTVQHQRGPEIGEAELSVVHFIVWSEKYWGQTFDRWMVSSVDTDQWMIILLAMGNGKIRPRGEGEVRVTVRRVAGGRTKYILVNRVYDKICTLRDGSESAWPADDFDGWVPCDDDKVRLFVLVYLLAGCDFLPAISGMPFEKMWTAALQSVREPGVFRKPLFLEEGGTWVLDEMEAVKLLATMFFFKHEAAFRTAWRSPAEILRKFDGDVSRYVEEIRFVIWRKRDKKSTSTCPSFMSKVLQAKRAGSVLGYWQGGLEEKMRAQGWNGKGWGLNPTGTWAEGEKLTAENCVLWLSEHSYIGPDRKTVTLTCGCAPEKAAKHRCRSCGCKGRSCSLMCGCRGSCQMERAHSNEVSQADDKVGEDDSARNGDTYVPEEDGEGDDEPEIDVEADDEDGIPEWNKSDDESGESDDDDVDPLVEGGEMGGGISELLDDVQF